MPYATTYPAENASFNSVVFFENIPSSRRPTEAESITVGRTLIGRYTRLDEITLTGFCGSSERGSLRSAVNSSHTLVWSGGSDTAYLKRFEAQYHPEFSVYEISLTFVL